MKFNAMFKACSSDYFGYIHPKELMLEINEGITVGNFHDGVGFTVIYPAIGATWMLGQCVLEYIDSVYAGIEVEIEAGGHEQFGVSTVRRCTMRQNGKEVARFAAKLLPVDFEGRKVLPPSALESFWKNPAVPCGEPINFIQIPDEMELMETYRVRYRDCDSNRHMTAFRYLDLILETVGYWDGDAHLPERVQIDFKRECLPGEILHLSRGERDGVLYCSGVKEDGTVAFLSSVKLSERMEPMLSDMKDLKVVHA